MKVDPKVNPSVKSGKVLAGKVNVKLDGPVKDGKVNPMRDIPEHHWERAFKPGRIERNEEGTDLVQGGFNKVEQVFYPKFCEPDYKKRMSAEEVKKGEGKPNYPKKSMTSKPTRYPAGV